ncbi:MAG: DUF2516 family protein [Mycobacteriales bacterium]
MSFGNSPYWVLRIVGVIDLVVLVVCIVVVVWAFAHCARQRSDAFTAVGTLSKGAWLLIMAGSAAMSLLLSFLSMLFGLVALTAGLIYLLDVRPAIKDAITGNW